MVPFTTTSNPKMMTNSLQVAKKDMRRRIRNILLEVSQEGVISQSALATTKLFSLAEYRNAKRISVYLSMPHSEIATKGIVQDALKSGKEVFIPHIHRDSPQSNVSVMDMLSLNSLEEFESLNPDKWGIPSLSDEHIPNKPNCFGGYGVSARSTKTPGDGAGLDLVVMPGMAFDADLKRLGHGKGYYDNFLSRYWKEMERSTDTPRMPFLVALALKEQIIPPGELIPVCDHDWAVNAIIVGDGRFLTDEGRERQLPIPSTD